MVHLQNRITLGLDLLSFFTLRKWNFKSENFQKIREKYLTDEEHKMFYVDTTETQNDEEEYIKNVALGARQYMMKESLSTLPKARLQIKALVAM
jgi:fatty acyl-CoA reductase